MKKETDSFAHGEVILEELKKKEERERLRKMEISLQETQTKLLEKQTNFNKWLTIATLIIATTSIVTIVIELIKLRLL